MRRARPPDRPDRVGVDRAFAASTTSPSRRSVRLRDLHRGVLRLHRDGPVVLARRTGPGARPLRRSPGPPDGAEVLFVALGSPTSSSSISLPGCSRAVPPTCHAPQPRPPSPSAGMTAAVRRVARGVAAHCRRHDQLIAAGELPGISRAVLGLRGRRRPGVDLRRRVGAAESGGTEGAGRDGRHRPGPMELDRVTAHTLRLRMVGLPVGATRLCRTVRRRGDALLGGPDLVVPVPALGLRRARGSDPARAGARGRPVARPASQRST